MTRLKRAYAPRKKSILVRGKERFRTHADALEAQKLMHAFAPKLEHYEFVELMAANNVPKTEAAAFFGITFVAFDKHFGDHYERGRLRRNLKVTRTLFEMANGNDGLYDDKTKKWILKPKSPDVTAVIWWDKTRGGWREGKDVKLEGGVVQQSVVVYLPSNGREAGAAGDPTFVIRKQIEAKAVVVEDEEELPTPKRKGK